MNLIWPGRLISSQLIWAWGLRKSMMRGWLTTAVHLLQLRFLPLRRRLQMLRRPPLRRHQPQLEALRRPHST